MDVTIARRGLGSDAALEERVGEILTTRIELAMIGTAGIIVIAGGLRVSGVIDVVVMVLIALGAALIPALTWAMTPQASREAAAPPPEPPAPATLVELTKRVEAQTPSQPRRRPARRRPQQHAGVVVACGTAGAFVAMFFSVEFAIKASVGVALVAAFGGGASGPSGVALFFIVLSIAAAIGLIVGSCIGVPVARSLSIRSDQNEALVRLALAVDGLSEQG